MLNLDSAQCSSAATTYSSPKSPFVHNGHFHHRIKRSGRKACRARSDVEQHAISRTRCTRHICQAASVEEAVAEAPRRTRKPLHVVIAGAPAAGKGTQCAKIVEKHGLVHVSAGDLLRAEVEAGTEAGKLAKRFMDDGNLVPNEVVVDMVVKRLQQEDAISRGWLLDGYPRSSEQAEAIEAAGIRPDAFILINVNDEELVERVVGRRLDPVTGKIYHLTYNKPPPEISDRLIQRSDDTEEKLRNRLAGHHQNVQAVIGYYKQEMMEVDGSKSMEEVAGAIDRCLSGFEQERN